MIKLEIGKRYLTRGGLVTRPIVRVARRLLFITWASFSGSVEGHSRVWYWREDGTRPGEYQDSEMELVAEAQEGLQSDAPVGAMTVIQRLGGVGTPVAPAFPLSFPNTPIIPSMPAALRCECGGDKTHTGHSHWCPRWTP